MLPPTATATETGSPNKKKAPTEETTGSPSGTAATVVVERFLIK